MNTLERLQEAKAAYAEAEEQRTARARMDADREARRWLAAALGTTDEDVPGYPCFGGQWRRIDLPGDYSLRLRITPVSVTGVLERNGHYRSESETSRNRPPKEALGYLLHSLGVDLEGGTE